MRSNFAERYGSYALVAGAAIGIGFAYAKRTADLGLDLVEEEALASLGENPSIITGQHNREALAVLRTLPIEQAVEGTARHAIDNFLGGRVPEQET